MNKVQIAKDLAKQFNSSEIRKCGETLFDHILKVYDLLIDIGVTDETTLVIALLHHIDGYDKNNEETLRKAFGDEIYENLVIYRKFADSEFKLDEKSNLNEGFLLESVFKLAQNSRTLLVRLADKTDNIRTIFALDDEQRIRVAKRALYFYAPLAKLLGLRNFSGILEEESFKVLFPKEYFSITQYIETHVNKHAEKMDILIDFIKDILNDLKFQAKVESRIKSKYSLFKKAINYIKKGKIQDDEYHKIKDLFALRIITNTVDECYIVENALREHINAIEEERDDYIAKPKPSGYRSIHNVFEIDRDFHVEVQIKTNEMHELNEYGHASHFFYKFKDASLKTYITEETNWLKNINFMESRQIAQLNEIVKDKIYVFTSKGDIIELPNQATPLDFAFAVHADLGKHYLGAKINGKIAKMSQILKDGDKVEILESNKPNVNLDCLKYVKTLKAKKEIKKHVRETQKALL